MQSKTKRPSVQSKGKPTSFSKHFTQRQKAECELRSITRRLHNANKWIPTLKEVDPLSDPSEILTSLRKRQIDLLHKVRSMRDEKKGEPGKFCLFGVPGMDGGFDPNRFGEFVLVMRMLDKFKAVHGNPSYQLGTPDDDTKQAWSTSLISTVLNFYPDIQWSDDSSASYSSSWEFNAFMEARRGIVGHKGYVSVDPPPFYKPWADPNHAQLMNFAALAFDVPSSPFEAIVNFEANVCYAIQLAIDADIAFFYGGTRLCVQQDALTGDPNGVEDFDSVGQSIFIEETGDICEVRNSIISGNYHVNADVPSRIHIGLGWNLTVENGAGGTARGYDSLIILPPNNEDYWGLRVNIVPL